jgi:hypothetical protein
MRQPTPWQIIRRVTQSSVTVAPERRRFLFALSGASRRPSLRSRWLQRRLHAMCLARVETNGLATATPETVHAGKRPIEVVRVRITDAGKLALAG